MSANLKPCPMCGQEAIHFMHPEMPDSHIVGCVDGDCLAHQLAYDFTSRESASAAWNARAAPTEGVGETPHPEGGQT